MGSATIHNNMCFILLPEPYAVIYPYPKTTKTLKVSNINSRMCNMRNKSTQKPQPQRG